MPNLYRNLNNNKLYILEHLIRDIKHLSNNGFAGIYAFPYFKNRYRIDETTIIFYNRDHSKCKEFIEKNFIKAYQI